MRTTGTRAAGLVVGSFGSFHGESDREILGRLIPWPNSAVCGTRRTVCRATRSPDSYESVHEQDISYSYGVGELYEYRIG